MTNSRPGEFVALVGTLTIFTGASILVVSWATSSIPAFFLGALFGISGLLLRIEAAVLRVGKYEPPAVEPSPRPWRADPDGPVS